MAGGGILTPLDSVGALVLTRICPLGSGHEKSQGVTSVGRAWVKLEGFSIHPSAESGFCCGERVLRGCVADGCVGPAVGSG